MRWGGGQRGQATVEWIGLVLVAALALGALLGGVRGAVKQDTGLGEAVAKRITCAARDLCRSGAGAGGSRVGAPDARAPRVRAGVGPRRTRPQSARSKASDAFQRLRGVAGVARYAWIACLGYRGWRYELEHPRTPREGMSIREALDIANSCLNPLAFLIP